MDYLILILLAIVSLCIWLYFYFQRKFVYWSSKGVSGPKPRFLFGNLWDYMRTGQVKLEKEWLQKYGKVYGIYHAAKPVLSILDADSIKRVLISDFHVFVNRDKAPFDHEIWSNNLFNSEDEQWKRIRTITTPTFTTGKLRGMRSMMNQCVHKLVDHFQKRIIQMKDGKFNARDVTVGFAMDVIAATSFATEINSNDPSTKSVFREMGLALIDLNPIRFAALFAAPKWFNKLIGSEIGFLDKPFAFCIDLVREVLRKRKLNNEKRNDLIQLLMNAQVDADELKGQNYDRLTAGEQDAITMENKNITNGKFLDENEIVAQSVLFLIGGFEATSVTITYCLYHLAIYPDVQTKLNAELELVLSGLDVDGEEYFDRIVNGHIAYLDAFIKETLRMCPPATRLQRRVGVDDYLLAGIHLPKNTLVEISTFGVHYCADYYPEPEQFNPSRFMPENKHLLVPYTYLPFGGGPRNCVGMRFAYQEIKLCLARLSRQFRFEPTEQTKIPLNFSKFAILSVKDVPLRVVERSK